jgi:aminopeptidase-like protein|tara:strand:- start:640 stop:2028 length:1389 start_codon:yes stop_codon:yes gene_type:complete
MEDSSKIGEEMYGLIKDLFPICRSITGNGTRETLKIISELISIDVHEVHSGTRVFDWIIPNEWNIKDAYIKSPKGEKLVDFKESNLHILYYSTPIHKKISLKELKEHILTQPDRPKDIPYRTSYYSEKWGFCMSHEKFLQLEDGDYEVLIDSELKQGSLTYGEYFFKGKSDEEVLLSCYICHPSLCNDSLSGIVTAVQLAKFIENLKQKPNYSYRILFIPETIGSITWLSRNQEKIKKIKHGLIITCTGDLGQLNYKKSRQGNAEIDQTVIDVLKNSNKDFSVLDFFPFGSDERQYCYPGINLSMGCLTRTVFGDFPEYHTSADNLTYVHPTCLAETFGIYTRIIEKLEENFGHFSSNQDKITKMKVSSSEDPVFVNLVKCEPQLGKRDLYHDLGGPKLKPFHGRGSKSTTKIKEKATMWILAFSDGTNSIKDIERKSNIDFEILLETSNLLCEKKLLKEFK